MTSILSKNSVFKQHLLLLTIITLTLLIHIRCTENRASESFDKNPPRNPRIDTTYIWDGKDYYYMLYRRGEFLVDKKHKNYKENCAYLKSQNFIKSKYASGNENVEVFVKILQPHSDSVVVFGPKPPTGPIGPILIPEGIIANFHIKN